MSSKGSDFQSTLKVSLIISLFLLLAGSLVFKTGIFSGQVANNGGLSKKVAVKGSVDIDALDLSSGEVQTINQAVDDHKDMFTQIDLFLDAVDNAEVIDGNSRLVFAMVLGTNSDCEIRSWSRKISRADLVAQMVLYLNRAAKEYEQFKRFPDVKQNFKCLYI